MRIRAAFLICAALAMGAAGAYAANNPPLAGEWNIQPTGRAASSGELVFRMTPGDGTDPLEITVPVLSGDNDIAVARDIRRVLSTQLRRDRYTVELGEGANVMVRDPGGQPNFSLELLTSDVDNLRVAVQSVTPAASPTVRPQTQPAEDPSQVPPSGPDDAPPPVRTPQPSTPTPRPSTPTPQPSMPPPSPSTPIPSPSTPPPTPGTPVPQPSTPSPPGPAAPPPNATGGAGDGASAPPPG